MPNLLKPKILKLVPYEAEILRQKTQRVNFPLSIEDQQIITDMLYSIDIIQLQTRAAGMAANQWGIDKSIFIFCPKGNDKSENLRVIINPSYEPIINKAIDQPNTDIEWEGCFSIPNMLGEIQRYKKIKVKYQTTDGKQHRKILSGWKARVWQHENNHLHGLLYDDPKAGNCLQKIENLPETD